jgi:hypothetical protein
LIGYRYTEDLTISSEERREVVEPLMAKKASLEGEIEALD